MSVGKAIVLVLLIIVAGCATVLSADDYKRFYNVTVEEYLKSCQNYTGNKTVAEYYGYNQTRKIYLSDTIPYSKEK
jgi:uncharacterized protein YceK